MLKEAVFLSGSQILQLAMGKVQLWQLVSKSLLRHMFNAGFFIIILLLQPLSVQFDLTKSSTLEIPPEMKICCGQHFVNGHATKPQE